MEAGKSSQEVHPDIMRRVGAIVLGGGRGTRLYPLTRLRAKPAVPLCGNYRLVDIPLSNCIHSYIKKVCVLTQFNSHSLNRHINRTYQFDLFSDGYVEVLTAEQTDYTGDWFQGTADAVRKQLLHIKNMGVDYYVILSGDQLYRMDYRMLVETHVKKKADITVSALPVTRKDAQAFGIMEVDADAQIQRFVEKPTKPELLDELVTPDQVFEDFGLKSAGKPYLASMGVYVFRAELLEKLLTENQEWVDFGKEIIPNSLGKYRVAAHMFDDFWEDIGTVKSYFEVSMAMTTENPPFAFFDPQHQFFTHPRMLPGAQVSETSIKRAIMCAGSRVIRADIEDCIIGIRSIVHPGARLERTIMLGAERFENEAPPEGLPPIGIGENTHIKNAIIDHNARIGRNVEIVGADELEDREDDNYMIRDGIVVVFKNGVIPDGSKIGAVS
jgi:glucose-1-phosphate adenylyltransferase